MSRTWWLSGLAGMALLAGACGADQSASTARDAGGASSIAALPTAAAVSEAPKAVSQDASSGAQQGRSGAEAGQPQVGGAPMPSLDRKLVYKVLLDLTVKDVQTGFEQIATIAETSGGFVAESNVRQEGEVRRASVTIRVPAGRYQDVLGQIRGLATKVETERATASDVTEEYTDLQSRQRNLEATEQQLLVFLGQAKNVQEVLQVQDRLNSTRAEIERVKGRINLLNRLSELATIQVQLRPESAVMVKAPQPSGPLAALQRGWDASTELLGGLSLAALTALAFSWWLLPLVALGLWLARREQRRREATPPAPPAEAAAP
jgi:Domain of unknown function (DUF4349)